MVAVFLYTLYSQSIGASAKFYNLFCRFIPIDISSFQSIFSSLYGFLSPYSLTER